MVHSCSFILEYRCTFWTCLGAKYFRVGACVQLWVAIWIVRKGMNIIFLSVLSRHADHGNGSSSVTVQEFDHIYVDHRKLLESLFVNRECRTEDHWQAIGASIAKRAFWSGNVNKRSVSPIIQNRARLKRLCDTSKMIQMHSSPPPLLRAGNGARTQQISGLHVASSDAMMDQLP